MATTNKCAETLASESFIRKFNNVYEGYAVPFYTDTLESIDVNICNDEALNNRNMLIVLYLHVDNKPFSDEFCSHLQNQELITAMEKNCFLVAWDIDLAEDFESLIESVKCTIGYNLVYQYLRKKTPVLFILKPIDHEIIKYVDDTTELTEFSSDLTQLLKTLNNQETEIIKHELQSQNNEISSERFQQMMLEHLGDRDFDSFECDEHEYLKNKIYFAIYGAADLLEKDKDRDKVVKELYKLIRRTNNTYAKWDDRIIFYVIYNCTESIKSFAVNMIPIPVFVIRKCKGSSNPCRLFIDLDLRVYTSWRRYLKRNKLPRCNMVVPKNGRYRSDIKGNVLLDVLRSPQCTNGAYALKVADVTVTALAIVAAILMVVSLVYTPVAIPAGILGIWCAIYSTIRTSYQIHDRRKHRMDMSVKNGDARGAYLNIAANSIGLVGGALTRTVTIVASRGISIGKAIIFTANAINYAGMTTDFVELLNAINAMKGSRRPDALQVLQMSFSLLFFNNSVVNIARTKGRLIQSEISATIRSNQTHGFSRPNNQTVSHLRSVHSQDVMKILSVRSNRLSAAKTMTFSGQNGKISLNGIPVVVLKQTVVKFQGLCLPPVQFTTEVIQKKYLTNEEDVRLYASILYLFPKTIQECILNITEDVLRKLKEEDINFTETIKKIFPHATYTCKVLEVVVKFLEHLHFKHHTAYESENENKLQYFNMIENIKCDVIIMDLVQFYLNWLTTAVYEHEYANINRIKRRERQLKYKTKVDCKICGGYYYNTSKQ